MNDSGKSPERWANDLSIVQTTALRSARFPVDVARLAQEYSQLVFPEEPITRVISRDFDGFEGALIRRPNGSGEWGIGYASSLNSNGRINFTIAHEFGHYLLHRKKFPNGLQCKAEDMAKWDSEYGQTEAEANKFAANLLMPLDDFRKQISPKRRTNLDELEVCRERYEVSLMAATLQWLSYTQQRALLVASRDRRIRWARSSKPAFRSGAYIKVSGRPPREVPPTSVVATRANKVGKTEPVEQPKGIWLAEAVTEQSLIVRRPGLSLSLLILEARTPSVDADETEVEDMFDVMSRASRRTNRPSWQG